MLDSAKLEKNSVLRSNSKPYQAVMYNTSDLNKISVSSVSRQTHNAMKDAKD